MIKTDYERQMDSILREVEKILIEGGSGQSLTITIKMGLGEVSTITYEINDKVVRF